ncbi:MAG: MG2 domain-containing protein, partial [Leadbetterella sp.]
MKKILLLLALVGVFSCNRLNVVNIKDLGFGTEVDLLQNLTFEFDENLMAEADLNHWESTPYIDFEPKIQGKFKWIGKNEVLFSPSKPMQFATAYKASINKNVLKRKKGTLDIDTDQEIKFNTPSLAVNKHFVVQSLDPQKRPQKNLVLELNHRYDSHDIHKDLIVTSNNKTLEYKQIPSDDPHTLILGLNDSKGNDIEVNFKKNSDGNPEKFKKDVSLDFDHVGAENLEILKSETSFKKLKGYIKIKTNQQLDQKQLETYVSLEPKVKISIETEATGFIIKGDFNQEDVYKLKIDKTITGVAGGKMDEDYVSEVYFGFLSPYLEFTHNKATYLSSVGNRNIGVNLVSIPKVEVKISKVYENNILPFLKSNMRYYDSESDEYYNITDDENLYSDPITTKKIETETLPKKQGVAVLNLPLPDQKSQKGIFFISVRSEDEYYRSIQKIVSLSDIGLIVKTTADQSSVVVYANEIMTTQAMKGVTVKLISNSNQEIASLKTDDKGVAYFKNVSKKYTNSTIAMVTATTDSDFNYLMMSTSELDRSEFDISGKIKNESGYDAFIYGDREIYRPGETINLNTVVRDQKWKTAADLPIKIIVKQPNGRELNSIISKTNANGALAHSVKLDRAAFTGFYNIDVFSGNDVLLGSKSIAVEEFMPDRIKVNLDGPDAVNLSVNTSLQLKATNLFGPPAADRKFETDISIRRKRFTAKGFNDFTFGMSSDQKFENQVTDGITDAAGTAKIPVVLPDNMANNGLLEGKAIVSVFDETGRPVHRQKVFDIH